LHGIGPPDSNLSASLFEYCDINPVKHGLVTRVCGRPFSSFHRDVAVGLFPQDWAGEIETLGEFGEAPVAQ
jgi:putative transposase